MKTCPECGVALKDEYQFCPEDGASLDLSNQAAEQEVTATAQAQPAPAVVLYCPACAAEYPLTFSECPVHHTALTRHNVPARVDQPPRAPRLHLVSPAASPDEQPKAESVESNEAPPRRSGIEAYEAALENLVEHTASDDAVEHHSLSADDHSQQDEASKYRKTATAVGVALALLALIGIYALISNASRKPAKPAKNSVAASSPAQQTVTVPTPQAALDYQEQAPATASNASPAARDEASAAPSSEVTADVR